MSSELYLQLCDFRYGPCILFIPKQNLYFFTNFNLLFFSFCKIQVGLTITHIYFSIPDKQIYMETWFEYPSLRDLTTSEHRPLYAHELRSSAVPFVSLQSVSVLEPPLSPGLTSGPHGGACFVSVSSRIGKIQ